MLTALYTLIILGLCIVVHELGHFISAILVGAIVKEFSIGFGQIIFSRKIKGIRFSIRIIPLGGFVKIIGDSPEDEGKDNPRYFTNLSFIKRFIVLISGVAFNLIFAFIILFTLYLTGIKTPIAPPMIKKVLKNTPAQKAGLKKYDIILSINGKEIKNIMQLSKTLQKYKNKIITLKVKREGKILNIHTKLYYDKEYKKYMLGVQIEPFLPAIVGDVIVNTPAYMIGLKKNDKILKINKTPIHSFFELMDILKGYKDKKVKLIIQRGTKLIEKEIKVETIKIGKSEIVNIGIEPLAVKTETKKYTFSESIKNSLFEIISIIKLNKVIFVEILKGEISFKKVVGGPVMIYQQTYREAKSGQSNLWHFIALLNITLFIFNILPIPLLDGGHILFLIIEKIIGSPIPQNILSFINSIFFALLILLAIYVTLNDILKLFLINP